MNPGPPFDDETSAPPAAEQAEIDRLRQEIQNLAADACQVEQRERRRLSYLLHDHVQQLLVGARMKLALVERGRLDHSARVALQQADALVNQALEASRNLAQQLNPPVLQEAGLSAALHWLARQMTVRHGLTVEVSADPQADPQDPGTAALLFGAARELLFNVVKHAGVSAAGVNLQLAAHDRLALTVIDAGRGFDPLSPCRSPEERGLGLSDLQHRLRALGGDLQIITQPGQGTQVELVLPR